MGLDLHSGAESAYRHDITAKLIVWAMKLQTTDVLQGCRTNSVIFASCCSVGLIPMARKMVGKSLQPS